ncbi:MAG: hypothetical protein ACJA1I_000973 [Zhongshania marina]|jgi:hypothetical protein
MWGIFLSLALVVAAVSIPLIFYWRAEALVKLYERIKYKN